MKVLVNRCYGGFGLSTKAVIAIDALDPSLFRKSVSDYFRTNLDYKEKCILEWKRYKETGKESFGILVFTEDLEYVLSTYSLETKVLRTHPTIIKIVEEMGKDSWSQCSELDITEVPDDVSWEIEEYDGREWIAESHRTW